MNEPFDSTQYTFVSARSFKARPDGTTFVTVTNKGFPGTEAEAMQHALDATEGFAFVLAGAKALLEHNTKLNLVPDRFPDGIGQH